MTAATRRTFLQATVAGAATLAAHRSARAAANDRLQFALIGAGQQGERIASYMLAAPDTQMTAICEINPERVAAMKALAPDVRAYTDWNELLTKETDLDAVLIALPEHTHAAAAIDAMNAGRDVFCEKPMAYAVDEAKAMIATRDKTGRVLQIGHQRRSNPLYYLAERLIQKEGAIGEVIRVDAFWDRWTDWKRPLPEISGDFSPWGFPTLDHLINWRLYRKYGHGLMTENGTHQMDAVSWLLGDKRPMRVCGMGATRYPDDRETHDVVSAEYMFEGDTIVRFTQDFHQGLNYDWGYGELFLGTDGALRITEQQELVLIDRQRRKNRVAIDQLGDIELGGLAHTKDELSAIEGDREKGGLAMFSYANEMAIFAHAVRNRTQPTCTGELGHNAILMTIVGTEAQLAGAYRDFARDMFI